jgi:hypothetical protein
MTVSGRLTIHNGATPTTMTRTASATPPIVASRSIDRLRARTMETRFRSVAIAKVTTSATPADHPPAPVHEPTVINNAAPATAARTISPPLILSKLRSRTTPMPL